MKAKDVKPIKKEEKKIGFVYILVEAMFLMFALACYSLDLPILSIICIFLCVFNTPFPDWLLEKAGKKPLNRNIKLTITFFGFIILCYMIPGEKITGVQQKQMDQIVEQMQEKQNASETTK